MGPILEQQRVAAHDEREPQGPFFGGLVLNLVLSCETAMSLAYQRGDFRLWLNTRPGNKSFGLRANAGSDP